MLSVLETLLNTVLVVGASVWGWLGLIGGLGGAFFVWHTLDSSQVRAPAAAFTFAIIFMVVYWQEIKKK